jgi:hypothetical protein
MLAHILHQSGQDLIVILTRDSSRGFGFNPLMRFAVIADDGRLAWFGQIFRMTGHALKDRLCLIADFSEFRPWKDKRTLALVPQDTCCFEKYP